MNKKKTIAVIDDDRELLEEIEDILELNNFDTKTYYDGRTALSALNEVLPDLILLDLKMDGLSGLDIIKILKQNDKTVNIPVIAMSGYFSNEKLDDLINQYGFRKCLVKPLNPVQIINEINNILN